MGQLPSRLVDSDIPPQVLSERSLAAVAQLIKDGQAKNIVVMTGAGISTAAGIPDFRSPKTGLYHNLARLNLPHPEAVFEIDFFRRNPAPFYALAKELYPGTFHPTVSHAFLALLASRGLLHMLFTQNIDCLERAAGVPPDLIVEAHGSFASQRCIECRAPYPDDLMREHVRRGEPPRCLSPQCPVAVAGKVKVEGKVKAEGKVKVKTEGESEGGGEGGGGGLVKPDIVFFGENLPAAFYQHARTAPAQADLVLVLGTSLQVHPFASLPSAAPAGVPRVLFNLERVGDLGTRADDVLCLDDCDAGIRRLADALGWRGELEAVWRALVGDEEAERQIAGMAGGRVGQDEVLGLVGDVEAKFHLSAGGDEHGVWSDVGARDEREGEGEGQDQGQGDAYYSLSALPLNTPLEGHSEVGPEETVIGAGMEKLARDGEARAESVLEEKGRGDEALEEQEKKGEGKEATDDQKLPLSYQPTQPIQPLAETQVTADSGVKVKDEGGGDDKPVS
ncbi:NAD-dependent deacetylase sirtuin-2 [Hypoxylon sp. NC1633]|nr:NAD-dependent deacetylase sirtuin-2 [Hypoxylon sp. NC1633]